MNNGRWSVAISVQPPAEPVTRTELKRHLRIDSDIVDQDLWVDAAIAAAREKIEVELGRALVRQTQILTLDAFPCGDGIIYLPNPPLKAVSSLQYIDSNGVTQTVSSANYVVDTSHEPGRIQPAYGFAWPQTRYQIASVLVTFTCGFDPSSDSPTDYAANIPKAIKQAMMLTVGTWFENRESVVLTNWGAIELPDAAKALIWAKRVVTI